MPCNWQTDGAFHCNLGSATGEEIAALKLYIALCLKANFSPRSSLPSTGCVQRSISQLCELVGLSRPIAIKGLRKLQQWGLLETKGGRPTIYHVTDYETAKYWTKLPRSHLYGGLKETRIDRLLVMPNRGKTTLHALQMYLYLASIRNRTTSLAKVTYDRLADVLAISRNEVSAAISALVGFELISVRLAEADEFYGERPSNVYWLRGTQVRAEFANSP